MFIEGKVSVKSRTVFQKQLNFLAPEYCFISYFDLDFYLMKLISGRLGPLMKMILHYL